MPEEPRRDRRTILRVILVAELVIAMVTAAAVLLALEHLDANIETLPEIPHVVAEPEARPEEPKQPINILVMGSDSRACDGCGIDNEAGGRRVGHHDPAARVGRP